MRFARASAKCVSPRSWSLVARHRSLGVGACKANLIKLTTSNERSNRQLKASFAQQALPVSSSSFEMSEQQYQVLQPVQVTNLGLKTYTGDNILSDCFSKAFVTEKDADGVVLGLENTNGAVAIQDFSLGKASICLLSSSIRFTYVQCLQKQPSGFAAAALQQFCKFSTQQNLVDDTSVGFASTGYSSRWTKYSNANMMHSVLHLCTFSNMCQLLYLKSLAELYSMHEASCKARTLSAVK